MFAYVQWATRADQKRGVVLRERAILHLRFCSAALLRAEKTPDWVLRRRAAAAAKQLRKLGASQAVFPDPFPYTELFDQYGVHPVRTLPLYRTLAADLVQSAMEKKDLSSGRAVIAVCTDRLSAEVQRAVKELCIRNRYVLLSAEGEGELLCRHLRREYGVSLVLTEDLDQLSHADIKVLFAQRTGLSGDGVVLNLYEEHAVECWPLTLSADLEEQVPPGCSRPQLFAALCQAGALRNGQVEIGGNHSCA